MIYYAAVFVRQRDRIYVYCRSEALPRVPAATCDLAQFLIQYESIIVK